MLTKEEAEALLIAFNEELQVKHHEAFVSALKKLKAMSPETPCDALDDWVKV